MNRAVKSTGFIEKIFYILESFCPLEQYSSFSNRFSALCLYSGMVHFCSMLLALLFGYGIDVGIFLILSYNLRINKAQPLKGRKNNVW